VMLVVSESIVHLTFQEGDILIVLFSFEKCSNDLLSERVSLGSF
jgi:hypothetical protein